MKSDNYIRCLIGLAVLASLAACETPTLRTNCWSKTPEVSRGVSSGTC